MGAKLRNIDNPPSKPIVLNMYIMLTEAVQPEILLHV
jgi:hypothetical protein